MKVVWVKAAWSRVWQQARAENRGRYGKCLVVTDAVRGLHPKTNDDVYPHGCVIPQVAWHFMRKKWVFHDAMRKKLDSRSRRVHRIQKEKSNQSQRDIAATKNFIAWSNRSYNKPS